MVHLVSTFFCALRCGYRRLVEACNLVLLVCMFVCLFVCFRPACRRDEEAVPFCTGAESVWTWGSICRAWDVEHGSWVPMFCLIGEEVS